MNIFNCSLFFMTSLAVVLSAIGEHKPTIEPPTCLSHCICSVASVKCTHQDLTKIPYSNTPIFAELLDVSYNNLAILPNNSFSKYPYLKVLYLKHSHISSLEPQTFKDLRFLKKVDLSNNYIKYIHPHSFSDSTTLETVILSNNILIIAPHNPILIAPSVTTLDLSECRLTQLPSNIFSGLTGLKELDISSNHLTELSPNTTLLMKHLSIVNTDKNQWLCNINNYNFLCWLSTKRQLHIGKLHRPVYCYGGSNGEQELTAVIMHCSVETIPYNSDGVNTHISEVSSNQEQSISDIKTTPNVKITLHSDVNSDDKKKETYEPDIKKSLSTESYNIDIPSSLLTIHADEVHETEFAVKKSKTTTADSPPQGHVCSWWTAKRFSILDQLILIILLLIGAITGVLTVCFFLKRTHSREHVVCNAEEETYLSTPKLSFVR